MNVPISNALHDVSKDVTGNFKKTHVTELTPFMEPQQHPEISEDVRPQPVEEPVFDVDAETFHVMQALFHMPNEGDVPGNIKWITVVKP